MSKGKKITLIVVLVLLALCLVTVAGLLIFKPKFLTYHQAEKMIKKGEYSKAITTLYELGDYKDSRKKLSDLTAEERYFATTNYAPIGLGSDGKLLTIYDLDSPNTSAKFLKNKAKNLVGFATVGFAASKQFIGLKKDGTVVSLIDYKKDDPFGGYIDISDWEDIVKIDGSYDVVAGVTKDGEVVVAAQKNLIDYAEKDNKSRIMLHCAKKAEKWKDIVDVSVGENIIVGLKADGTVVATLPFNEFEYSDYDGIEDWENIVAIEPRELCIIGLKADGTIVTTARYEEIKEWEDIVAISGKYSHLVGLKADGTVVAANLAFNAKSACEVEDWKNIIAVHAGSTYTLGLKEDGSIVCAGDLPEEIKSEIEDWNLFE